MTLNDLYDYADTQGITVDCFLMKNIPSLSMPDDTILLDISQLPTDAHETVCLAHEIGHCKTGSFYNINTSLYVREKCEYKADRWAVLRLLPFDQLQYAVRTLYMKTPYELAEYFGVTEPLIRKAFDVYKRMGRVI